ncbi:MAG TPA: hypothetical protein PK359_15035, partial [Burkholderiaceae bacterium]|nr:hypothetical protein [Burkholderiaceae bacterium]
RPAMNPLLEPAELDESECNAHGLYALPEAVFGRVVAPDSNTRPGSDSPGVLHWSVSQLFSKTGLNPI